MQEGTTFWNRDLNLKSVNMTTPLESCGIWQPELSELPPSIGNRYSVWRDIYFTRTIPVGTEYYETELDLEDVTKRPSRLMGMITSGEILNDHFNHSNGLVEDFLGKYISEGDYEQEIDFKFSSEVDRAHYLTSYVRRNSKETLYPGFITRDGAISCSLKGVVSKKGSDHRFKIGLHFDRPLAQECEVHFFAFYAEYIVLNETLMTIERSWEMDKTGR